MTTASFLSSEAREQAARAIASLEARTSAEIVIAIRERSSPYRAVDLGIGALCAFLALLLLLFLPQPFAVATMPLDVLVAFGLGALISSRSTALRRWVLSGRVQQAATRLNARSLFYELGVSRTRERTGVLIYVSLLERAVEVVPDIALDSLASEAHWKQAVEALSAPVQRLDYSAFLGAIGGLGPVLEKALPRREDDINELPDLPSVGDRA